MSFFPAKLKAKELTCWHIERPEPEHHAWSHCHEYNFAGLIAITPRIKAVIAAFYLELLTDKETLKVDSSQIPPKTLSKVIPGEPIVEMCSFQIRLSEEIKVPLHGYVVVKFNRGEAKCKVSIRVDDEYRPPLYRGN